MIVDTLTPFAEHLWQSAFFAGAAGLLTLALRNNAARVRHWVWVVASVKFLVPFYLLIALGSQVQWRREAAPVQPDLFLIVDQASPPFAAPVTAAPMTATLPEAFPVLAAVLWTVWACGFVGVGVSWWIRWRRIAAAVRTGSRVPLPVPIPVICSPSFLAPGVFGVLRPVLLLPEGIFEHLTPEQWKTLIAHELCHVRHRDNLITMVQMFVETVFWFHPLVWWIGKKIFEERERACDEEVLRMGSEPRAYARSILRVCHLYLASPLQCMASVSGSNLKTRIEAILRNRSAPDLNRRKKLLLAGAGMLAVLGPVVLGVMNAPLLQAQPKPPAPTSGLAFEVATIKPARDPLILGCLGIPCTSGRPTIIGSRLEIRTISLYDLIVRAYRIKQYQLLGPDWPTTQKFDIAAKMPDDVSREQIPEMLQSLLADRFGLSIHPEQQERPVYALVIGSKARLKAAAANASASIPVAPGESIVSTPFGEAHVGPDRIWQAREGPYGPFRMRFGIQPTRVEFLGITMTELAQLLAPSLDRVVVDGTALPGKYRMQLEWSIPPPPPPQPGQVPSPYPSGAPPASLSMRSVEAAGLKLDRRTAPVHLLVVDHVERTPAEN